MDDAIDRALEAKQNGEALSIGVLCNAVHLLQRLIERKIIPDTLTDQTSAHDPLYGYVPHTLTNKQAAIMRQEDPDKYQQLSYESMHLHVQLMLELQSMGAITLIMETISGQGHRV